MDERQMQTLLEHCRKIKLLVIGVDGVLTDAGMYFNENGDVIRKFNRRDGMGIQLLSEAGIKSAVISSMSNPIVKHFAETFNVDFIRLGIPDKWHEIEKLQIRCGLKPEDVAYISDDIDEYDILQRIGMAITVADGISANKKISTYVTKRKGGEGAVREAIEVIIRCKHADGDYE